MFQVCFLKPNSSRNAVDFNKLVERVKAILTAPKAEWPVIAEEQATVKSLYLGYIMLLAAVPPVFGFIEYSLIGRSFLGVHVRIGIGAGIGSMIVGWILALIGVYVVAWIIKALAHTFGGQPDQVQALKAIAYAYTASWVAGIGNVIPWIGWLIIIAGGIYSIYLLYLGLPHTMKCPPEKAAGYTAVTIVCSIIVYIIIGAITAGITGVGMFNHAPVTASSNSDTVTFDKDSTLGKLQALSERMQAAGKAAQATNKSDAAGSTAGVTAGAALSALAGSKTPIEALTADQLKAFLPDQLDGLKRTSLSASRSGLKGMQTSEAEADYGAESGNHLHLEITDLGGASGMMAFARLAGSSESQTDHGYQKKYQQDGNLVEEKWDSRKHTGEYSTTVADRFSVMVSGKADSIDALKRAVASIDLTGLAALKDQGVGK